MGELKTNGWGSRGVGVLAVLLLTGFALAGPSAAQAKLTYYIGNGADPCASRGVSDFGGIIELKDVSRGKGLAPVRTAILCGPVVTYPALATLLYDDAVRREYSGRHFKHELAAGSGEPVGGNTTDWPWVRGPHGGIPSVEKLTGSKLLQAAAEAFSKAVTTLEKTTAAACATGGYVGEPGENACQDAAIGELVVAIGSAVGAVLRELGIFFVKSREEMGATDWAHWTSNGSIVWNYFGDVGPKFVDPSMFHVGFNKQKMRAMVAISTAADGQGAEVFPGGIVKKPTINENVGVGGSPGSAAETAQFRDATGPIQTLHLNDHGVPDPAGAHTRVRGSALSERLAGGAGDDTVAGHGGADVLLGREGDDFLVGGRGFDVLRGGAGEDQLVPEGGGSLQFGGPGHDIMWGSTRGGPDLMRGGAGNDLLVARSKGVAFLRGGQGNDLLITLDRRPGDFVRCGSGRDRVYADPGDRIAADCRTGNSRVFVFSRADLRQIHRSGVVSRAVRRRALRGGR